MHEQHNAMALILLKIPDSVYAGITVFFAALLISPDKLVEVKELVGIVGIIANIVILAWKAYQERAIKREIEHIKWQATEFQNERHSFRQEIRAEVNEIKKQVENE